MFINRFLGAAALSVAFALAACGSPEQPQDAEATPHGYVAGAEEMDEMQATVAYAARGSSRLGLLDLASATEKDVTLSIAVQRLVEDGRFVYADDGGRQLEIVDAGVWTVDHTDHVHYYRKPARSLGTLTFDAEIRTITGFRGHTAIGTADGQIRVLDRRQLEAGQVAELGRIDSGSSTPLAVPYGDELIVAIGGGDSGQPADRIVTMAADGRRTGAETPCRAPRGWAVLRGGAVIACEDRLVRVQRESGGLGAKALTSPHRPVPTGGLGYRPRSNEAALAGAGGIWSVNAAKDTLRHLPAAGHNLVAAASPADGDTVLALSSAGTLLSLDLETGKVLAQKPVPATSLTIDMNRAYLPDPQGQVIHEIDYGDGLRTARTLPVAERPDLMVEVGR
ncbi:hypothetical protein ACN28C_33420 [Plantactinospora sp. WMMC1484]|uniref:hypothetical protein n=1 Tax=Plantactinospora sp. WMMC1484 TaxID=3404122 RepID=UPI003BF4B752